MLQTQRARLMRLSWEIQKRRKGSRSKSLFAAWAIYQNEDITVLHLVEKLSKGRQPKPQQTGRFSLNLFTSYPATPNF